MASAWSPGEKRRAWRNWLPARSLGRSLVLSSLIFLLGSCTGESGERPLKKGEAVRITFIHTTDWHSRLVPYTYATTRIDRDLGIDEYNAPFGGVARMAYLIKKLRAENYRVLYLDSGDSFQGAPIFNLFQGEVEMKAYSLVSPDAYALGNHDFDSGARNLYDRLAASVRFPVLAANYIFLPQDDPRGIYLGDIVQPLAVINVHGLKVAVIGMGNLSTMTSVGEAGNSLGIQPLEEVQVLQSWIDYAQAVADLVVLNSHLGLDEDERIVRQTSGLDLVFGGHHHVVLNPPKVVTDNTVAATDKTGRKVPIIHSGVFLKFVGVLDAVVQDGEVVSTQYRVHPIDSRLPEDYQTLNMLEPYLREMNQQLDLRRVLAYAPKTIPRYGKITGDSALGDLVSKAMRARRGVETDFALTNSLGIRADFSPGPIAEELLFNVFPFENYVTKMMMSGKEIIEMLDFVAQRSASRGCQSQVQVDGIRFKMHCLLDEPTGSWVDEVYVGGRLEDGRYVGGERIVGPRQCYSDKTGISPISFDVAVNDYIAKGGSGFYMLKVNPNKVYTSVSIRTAVADQLRKLPACGTLCDGEATPEACRIVRKCVEDLTEYYAATCRTPWRTCQRKSDCPEGMSCVDEVCRICERGECESYIVPPLAELSTTGAAPSCPGEGEIPDPLRAGEQLGAGDVLYCYREDCWLEAEKRDPTRVPLYCRADVDPECVAQMRARATAECPVLPCVTVEEDGRIGQVTGTLKDLPAACIPEELTLELRQTAIDGDHCESEEVCW